MLVWYERFFFSLLVQPKLSYYLLINSYLIKYLVGFMHEKYNSSMMWWALFKSQVLNDRREMQSGRVKYKKMNNTVATGLPFERCGLSLLHFPSFQLSNLLFHIKRIMFSFERQRQWCLIQHVKVNRFLRRMKSQNETETGITGSSVDFPRL